VIFKIRPCMPHHEKSFEINNEGQYCKIFCNNKLQNRIYEHARIRLAKNPHKIG
jgi:hypothetical protein